MSSTLQSFGPTSYKAVEAAFIFREHVRSHIVILFDVRCYFPTLVRGIGRIRTTVHQRSKVGYPFVREKIYPTFDTILFMTLI